MKKKAIENTIEKIRYAASKSTENEDITFYLISYLEKNINALVKEMPDEFAEPEKEF